MKTQDMPVKDAIRGRLSTLLERHLRLIAITAILLKAALLFVALPAFERAMPGDYQAGMFPDDYDKIALNIVEGHGYRLFPETSETLLRTPGFVMVLAAVFALAGKNLAIVQGLNLVFASLSALLTCAIARGIGGSTLLGAAAALLYYFHPGTIMADSRGGIESMLTFCLMLLFWLSVRAVRSRAIRDFALVGITFGVTLLVKSTALLTLPALWLYGLVQSGRPHVRTFMLRGALAAVLAATVMSTWVVRNYSVSGHFVPTMTMGGLALFQGLYVVQHKEDGKPHHLVLDDAVAEQDRILHAMGLPARAGYFPQFYSSQDEVRYYRELGHRAWGEYLVSPSLLAQAIAHNFAGFWVQGRTPKATALNATLTLPLLLMAVVGVVMGVKHRLRVWPLVLFIAAFLVPHLPIMGVARYHIPLLPLLAVLAMIPVALGKR